MSTKKKILVVIGTRPNFIKITRFREVAARYPQFELRIVHTGQHYDDKMADVFFSQFGLTPDYFLEIPPGNPVVQMGEILLRLDQTFRDYQPDLVMVPGDVNSTLAAALAANKAGIRIAHIESGLRSFDRTMPEEFNRVLTDELADLLFVTEQSGADNLAREGKDASTVHFAGNTMIDTMVAFADKIAASPVTDEMGLKAREYVLMTMHRPGNVDSREGLQLLLELVQEVTQRYKIVFPVHPRTVKQMAAYGLEDAFRKNSNLILTEPLGYFAFQKLVRDCRFILTDSGGIQEESTFLGVPCLTLRPNTERPVTVMLGTNELLPFNLAAIREKIASIEAGTFKKGEVPPLWDGKATERIFETLSKLL